MGILEDYGRDGRQGRRLWYHPHFHFEWHAERVLAAISNIRASRILSLTRILWDLGLSSSFHCAALIATLLQLSQLTLQGQEFPAANEHR